MNKSVRMRLHVSAEQADQLARLQADFAEVCNALAPLVQQSRCWHRVTLHHLAYRALRERFPQVGSQLICNAIYAVCRIARVVFQHPASPFRVVPGDTRALPLLNFSPSSPVYLDRHTLSLSGEVLSLYTTQGRLRLAAQRHVLLGEALRGKKLREILLTRDAAGTFELTFRLAPETEAPRPAPVDGHIPDYVQVHAAP